MTNFEALIGKVVVIEYLDGRGKSIRTISILKEIKDGLFMMESPSQHLPFIVNSRSLVALYELEPKQS